MNSKRAVGVVAVVMLAAAVWAVARVAQRPAVHRRKRPRLRRRPSSDAKIALQFYRDPAPVGAVAMKDVDGRAISSADWTGKVVIVNFWATWCPPCRAEIPDLIALQNKYKDQLLIIGISDDDDPPEAVKKWAAEHKMNYPIVMNTPELRKTFTGVTALPTSFIVDRQSRIAMRHVGMLTAAVDRGRDAASGRPARQRVDRGDRERSADQARQRRADHRNSRRGSEGAAEGQAGRRDSEAERRGLHVRLQSHRRALPRGRPELSRSASRARKKSSRASRRRQLDASARRSTSRT